MQKRQTIPGLFSLKTAIEEYHCVDRSLATEIQGRQDEQAIRSLSHKLDALHDQIASAEPAAETDSLAQIMFFLDLSERWSEPSSDLHVAKRLIAKRLTTSGMQNTGGRISIIDTSFRYECTTRGNREFYNLAENDIIGRHVAEVIGQERFEGRARRFLEGAFSGERQEYYHLLQAGQDQRIMKCVMEPRQSETKGALVTMTDVTAEIENASGIRLIELRPAA